jgi:hypothetical protein
MSVKKDNLERALGCDVGRADTDGVYYRNQDLQWVCEPTFDDPGVTEPKPGAVPACILVEEQESS